MIDSHGWGRKAATLVPALAIFLFGVPSALSGHILEKVHLIGARSFFDSMDYLVSNWMMPLGGLFTALFVGFRMDVEILKREYASGKGLEKLFTGWFYTVKYVCPIAVTAVFLHMVGLF